MVEASLTAATTRRAKKPRPFAIAPFVLVLASCRDAAPPPAPAPPSYRVVDDVGSFLRFWDAHPDAASRTPAAFRAEVAAARPSLYSPVVLGPYGDDAHLAGFLADVGPRVPAIRAIDQRLTRDLGAYDATFRRAIPDMSWSGTVYFLVSLDSFDGATREVDGRVALLFGVDKMAKLHGERGNLEPLFHHELFHLYHQGVTHWDDGPGMLAPLWSEGLAVWVSYRLNPTATVEDLVLTPEMVREVTARLPAMAHELRARLDDGDETLYRDYFLGRGQRADVPKRGAYYVGYLVARRVAAGKTIPALARMTKDEARVAVGAALDELERDPPRDAVMPPP